MQDAFREVLQPLVGRDAAGANPGTLRELAASLVDQLSAYRPHWRNDPVFDRSSTAAALPEWSCPVLGHDQLVALSRFALDHDFREAGAPLVRAADRAPEWLPEGGRRVGGLEEKDLAVGLRITGHGGGDWVFQLAGGRLVGGAPGLPSDPAVTFYLSCETLRKLRSGEVRSMGALEQGRALVMGRVPLQMDQLSWLLDALVSGPG